MTPINFGLSALGGNIRRDSGGGFSPLDVDGLYGWYDFSDIGTLSQDSLGTIPVASDGDVIGLIGDKSGVGNKNFTQPSTSLKYTYKANIKNGLSAGLFGVGDYLQSSIVIPQPISVYAVIFPSTFGSSSYYLGYAGGTASPICRVNSGTEFLMFAGGVLTTTVVQSQNTWHILYHTFNGALSEFRQNNNSKNIGNAGSNIFSNLVMGKSVSSALSGYYAELIIVDKEISSEDDASLLSYLNEKWAVY